MLSDKYDADDKYMEIDEESFQDIINIATGVLAPLKGFMCEEDYHSVVEKNTLVNGDVFTIPITLEYTLRDEIQSGEKISLIFNGKYIANISVEDIFETTDADWKKVFGTGDYNHPGVKKEIEKCRKRVGGQIEVVDETILDNALKPLDTKKVFLDRGWETIVGFQTRNPIHKAHEYIQRLGLEMCDGLFINPLVGWKKKGDFSEEAVMSAYEVMINNYYPKNRVYIAGLKTQMRYAGPREAVFHAIIRRNLGCTHFTIGRDHAGVGGYYGEYDAHKFAKEIESKYDLGINLILTREPYYCSVCNEIVTDRTCGHYETGRVSISGTKIRQYITEQTMPDERFMRRDILEAIIQCGDIFID
ncbi:sulfate adenylyltransferase [Butyrivibrio fibrisolvens]|uniref:sulfate adenylyltransferase n=1 Tax=Pseudobutyrivibrio ruminis TaxID=46206 RepID=UPI0004212FA3|nr:sulfate adenylyltransferase [Pseudobutyrivibrio ruminis]MDC7279119.1 sulfate adenylyltransferase [Butyrivibrio fibrisolvens]